MGKTILSQSFGTVIFFWVRETLELQLKVLFFSSFFFKQGILFSLLHTEHIHSHTTEIAIEARGRLSLDFQ